MRSLNACRQSTKSGATPLDLDQCAAGSRSGLLGAPRVLARKAARGKATVTGPSSRGQWCTLNVDPGRRFILRSFFYSEAEEALRRKINAWCDGSNVRHIKCDEFWKLNHTRFRGLVSRI